MISVFLREQRRYSQDELVNLFQCAGETALRILRRLKEYGVVKAVRAEDPQRSLTDLADDNTEIPEVGAGENEALYVFTFVGVITIGGRVLKCCPKYFSDASDPKPALKQVLKVLEKYHADEQMIRPYHEVGDSGAFHMLAVMLFLLQDYFSY